MERTEGIVKWYNYKKNYGFIEKEGRTYFVHKSHIPKGTRISEGDEVTFEPVETDKGLQARNIRKEEEEEE